MSRWLLRRAFGGLVRLELARLRGVARGASRRGARLPFPCDLTQLAASQQWCTDALRQGGALPQGAVVERFEVVPFATDLAFRSTLGLITLEWRDGDARGRLEVVAKMAPEARDLGDHAIYLLQKNHLKEAGFYAELAADSGVAPHPWHVSVDAKSGHFCILMEYVTGLQAIDEADGCPPDLAHLVARRLAGFHALHWGLPGGRPSFAERTPGMAIDWIADGARGPGSAFRRAVVRHAWRHDLADCQTVLHGDARIGNMLLGSDTADARFVLYDWQAARVGRGAFDLAYFATLCMQEDDRRACWDALLDSYHQALVAAGVTGYDRATLDDDAFNGILLTLAFVTLPLLSKEASATDPNAAALATLREVWRRRAVATARELDPDRVARWCDLDVDLVREELASTPTL